MVGIVPNTSSGAVPVGTIGLTNVVQPPAPFTVTCAPLKGVPDGCGGQITPAQINAIVSELLALAACMAPNGTWNCTSLDNLCSAFSSYAASIKAVSSNADNMIVEDSNGRAYLKDFVPISSGVPVAAPLPGTLPFYIDNTYAPYQNIPYVWNNSVWTPIWTNYRGGNNIVCLLYTSPSPRD
jgi:hypothetical protein